MSEANPTPWNFNPRGASMTFTDNTGKAYVYYFCLIDFPSIFDLQHEVTFQGDPTVSPANTNGQFNYNPLNGYSSDAVVYYGGPENPGFYTCIKNTPIKAGPFDPSLWQFIGANAYQLNFVYNDLGDGWPNPDPKATVITYNLPLFTTQSGYDPSMGPIISMSVTCSTSSTALVGDPNRRKPPIVNLPLSSNNGGTAGVPVPAIFSSATYETGQNYWVMACINTSPGNVTNKLDIFPADPYFISFHSKPGNGPLAAVGIIQAKDANPIGGISFPNGQILAIPNPMSTCPNYYVL